MRAAYEFPSETVTIRDLSVVLVGGDGDGRRAIAEAFRQHQVTIAGELGSYPSLSQLEQRLDCDIMVVDLDSDPDTALDLVEKICARFAAVTVMVYSRRHHQDLLVRAMRAGAREFLTEPLTADTLAEALDRASARRADSEQQKQAAGKVFVFWGAKGGAGVTTLAGNFAIALRKQSGQEVGLADLNIELGDLAVTLGLTPVFSVSDALRNSERLDQEFLSSLLVEHRSGVSLLAAPDQFTPEPLIQNGNLTKLLNVLRRKFPYVVVDAGPGLGRGTETVLEMADLIYLVTEADITSLRNAERFLSYLRRPGTPEDRLQVVLNRFDSRRTEISEERIARALSAPLKWKIPNDFAGVCRSLNAGTPLALENSPVSRVLHGMAREACGQPASAETKRKWNWF